MATVLRPNNLVLNTPQDTIDYLVDRLNRPKSPFNRGDKVNIINRAALPANLGWYEVGVVIECPDESPSCFVLVLTSSGGAFVAAIPKAHLALR